MGLVAARQLVDMVELAYDEQQEQWGSCMDRMMPNEMKTAYAHLQDMERALRAEMKRRGVSIPQRLFMSADEEASDG